MNNYRKLSGFEKKITEYILRKEAPKYLNYLPYLLVKKNENTGVGVYVYFMYSKDSPPITSMENKTIGYTVYIEVEGLDEGAGAVIYIDEGRITMLEVFSHGSETWPKSISKFEIMDL